MPLPRGTAKLGPVLRPRSTRPDDHRQQTRKRTQQTRHRGTLLTSDTGRTRRSGDRFLPAPNASRIRITDGRGGVTSSDAMEQIAAVGITAAGKRFLAAE